MKNKPIIKRVEKGVYEINGELNLDTLIVITHLEGQEPKIEVKDGE